MSKPILNVADVELTTWGNGDKFEAKIGWIGPKIGAKKLGYNVTVLAPGKRAFPCHAHTVNEEMFFVLEGEGKVRIGKETYAIKKGDVIACAPGGENDAHQIVNDSTSELRYLAVSTKLSPEVALYPDSGKVGVLAEVNDASGKAQMKRYFAHDGTVEEYWKGE